MPGRRREAAMFDDIEILVDLDGTILMVVAGAEPEPSWIVIECVTPDDAFAPQE
jgi:hypothetical protein